MREPFDSNAFYHVYNRGVDKRVVFDGGGDFQRFYESLYLFNDANYRHPGGRSINREVLLAGHEMRAIDRVPLVRILSFCLRPNHFHLLLKAREPNGISKFLHRLEMGYANYFNLRNARKGRLWESAFKAKAVDYEEHLQLLPRYIHLNALDGSSVSWRSDGVSNWDIALSVLAADPWSSHGAYMGWKETLPVLDLPTLQEWFPSASDYLTYLKQPKIFGLEEITFARL